MLTAILTHAGVAIAAGAWAAYRTKPPTQSLWAAVKVVIMGPRPTTPK